MISKENSKVLIALLLIISAAALRLVPHPYNFAPIAGMALFGGYAFQNRLYAFAFPLFAMFLSDLILGMHSGMYAVYGCFILMAFMGTRLKNHLSFFKLASSSLMGSLLFFVVTNLDVWIQQPLYEKSWKGLAECYAMALPFFHWTLIGDLSYALTLFGIYLAVERKLISPSGSSVIIPSTPISKR
jgi:hypothetical protein